MILLILFWYSTGILVLLYLSFFPVHPIFMSLMLVMFSLLTGLILNKFIHQWLMISILFIFLGGMMVIFLYCSFMSNEDKLVLNPMKFIQISCFILIFSAQYPEEYYTKIFNFSISFMSQSMNNQMILFLLFYLLLTLFLAVVFTKSFKGAMHKIGF